MKHITADIFRVESANLHPVCGGVLIAEPFMEEKWFRHGVVSIIDYLPGAGATGVVMNNRTEYMLPDLLEGVDSELTIPVFCGGPLGRDRLYFIHTLGPDIIEGSREYAPGMYVGGSFDDMITYINGGYEVDGVVRFFIGYSNWAGGQLERELDGGSWVHAVGPELCEVLLHYAGDAAWHRAVRTLGDTHRPWTLIPRNPLAN